MRLLLSHPTTLETVGAENLQFNSVQTVSDRECTCQLVRVAVVDLASSKLWKNYYFSENTLSVNIYTRYLEAWQSPRTVF